MQTGIKGTSVDHATEVVKDHAISGWFDEIPPGAKISHAVLGYFVVFKILIRPGVHYN